MPAERRGELKPTRPLRSGRGESSQLDTVHETFQNSETPKNGATCARACANFRRSVSRKIGGKCCYFSLNCTPNCTPPPGFAYISLYNYKIIELWLYARSRERREELTYIGFCRRKMVPELSQLYPPSRICICKSCNAQCVYFVLCVSSM